MKFIRLQKYKLHLMAVCCMALLAVTIEMRLGRVYFILQFLLFRESLQDFLLYLAVFGVAIWSLTVFLFNANKVIRLVYLALLFPLLLISISYRLITGYNFGYQDAQLAIENLNVIGAAFLQYLPQLLLAGAGVAIITALLVILQKKIKPLYSSRHAFVFLPVLLLCTWYVKYTVGNIDDLPAFYRIPVDTSLVLSQQLPIGNRDTVTAKPEHTGVKHLFLIVDESITGSSLSLNGNPTNTTPYLNSVKDSLINFGIASAITNYSAGTNIALISGINTSDLPDYSFTALTKPSIFQYAKQAGYITYYIDAQNGQKELQNYLSPNDLQYIDHFVQPIDQNPDLPYYHRDKVVASLLMQLSASDQKVFAYVNKAGAHWPYARTYPANATHFKPVLDAGSMLQDKELARNTYYNALRWTVDDFWKDLVQNISSKDSTLLVYTSDHGQNLTRDGITITHASANNADPVEADVPLWLLDKSGYTKALPKPRYGQQHQEQIFPTLLLFQGYDPAFIRKNYGSMLFQKPPKSRSFLSGDIFGRGSAQMLLFNRKK